MKYFIIFVISFFSFNVFAEEGKNYQWIQYVTDNKVLARAITNSSECPMIFIDDKSTKMKDRATYNDTKLSEEIKVCEYDVTKATKVSINNQQLKMPKKEVSRFVVIGDSGCENSVFSKRYVKQQCNETSWPFKTIANKIAQLDPDFVIHMGDYAYMNKYTDKEDEIKNQKMQWYFFEEEFFKPAKNLLNNAPMLFVRGNHESCKLTGRGWFLFLDPSRYTICSEYTAPYNIQIGGLNFAVFDVSESAPGKSYNQYQLEKYKKDFENMANKLNKPAWMLIHIPILGMNKLSEDEEFYSKINALVVNKAFGRENTKKLPVAISGHYHLAAQLTRKSDGFRQFIFGNGGTAIHKSKKDTYLYDYNNDIGLVKVKYGYAVFDKMPNNTWKVTSYGIDGTVLFTENVPLN